MIECRFRIEWADPNTGIIHCSAGEDARAWFGEKMEINLVRSGNGTQIYMRASAKGPMVTSFGKTEDDVDDFFMALTRRFQYPQPPPTSVPPPATSPPATPPPPTPPPPPPPPKQCSACSADMRYIPEYQRWYCDKCEQYN
ncbi:MAG: hypothetical protein JSV49_04645 [Thermoplasmata archaeon]|nr:MAG: hypothetical protein JSV49_04645 [Thermoplasmata archaeon]